MNGERFLVTDIVPEGFVQELMEMGFAVDYIPVVPMEEFYRIAGQYEGIVVNTQIIMDSKALALAGRLKYLLRPGSGLDNIDLPEAQKRNIQVYSSPEANRDAVAEHSMALLLSLLNHIPRAWAQVQAGHWIRRPNTGTEIKGKTVGIIGYGNNGTALAERLSGFGCRILVYDKYKTGYEHPGITETTLEHIKAEAQILSLHIPLTSETHHLISDSFIDSFANPFYLVNTSRGPIADTPAILRGLQSGKLLGAALDVLENERLDSYSGQETEILKALMNENVIITPHIAGWSSEARKNIFFKVLEKFRDEIKKEGVIPAENDHSSKTFFPINQEKHSIN